MAEELVRVRVGGIEKNMGRSLAEASDDVTVLADESPYNPDGSLRRETRKGGRPVKPRTTVDEAAEGKRKPASRRSESVESD